jgi:glycosyltransferase involved in cell wall biosynthesis
MSTREAHSLISAYACHPTEGSEPGVGWQILRAAIRSSGHVTLLTRGNNVAQIKKALCRAELEKCSIVAHDLPRLFQSAKKLIPGGTNLYYCFWQLSLGPKLRRVHNDHPVSLGHHVTFAVNWTPLGLMALPESVPIIWGPIGGATHCPTRLLPELGLRGLLSDSVRAIAGLIGRRLFGRKAAARAKLVIAQNPDDFAAFRHHAQGIIVEPNTFIEPSILPLRRESLINPYLLVGVGRLLPWKGWAIAFKVLRYLPAPFHLQLYGEGPDRKRLAKLARRLGVERRVTLMGQTERAECLSAVASARCFLFPSTHDSAGASLAEALSIGTPVVCLDVGGPGELVRRSGTGLAVDVKAPNLYAAIAEAVLKAIPDSTDRWLSNRSDDMVRAWYEAALSELGT